VSQGEPLGLSVTRQVVDLARPHFSISTSSEASSSLGRRAPTCFADSPIWSAMFFDRK
jgi:hypothetical protein